MMMININVLPVNTGLKLFRRLTEHTTGLLAAIAVVFSLSFFSPVHGAVTLTVNNGSGSGSYIEGEVLDIVADQAPSPDKVFDKWIGDISVLADPSSVSTMVTIPTLATELMTLVQDFENAGQIDEFVGANYATDQERNLEWGIRLWKIQTAGSNRNGLVAEKPSKPGNMKYKSSNAGIPNPFDGESVMIMGAKVMAVSAGTGSVSLQVRIEYAPTESPNPAGFGIISKKGGPVHFVLFRENSGKVVSPASLPLNQWYDLEMRVTPHNNDWKQATGSVFYRESGTADWIAADDLQDIVMNYSNTRNPTTSNLWRVLGAGNGVAQLDDFTFGTRGAGSVSDVTVTATYRDIMADQTLSFELLSDKIISDAPFAISATATSGLTVTLSSTTADVCTVDAGTVTIISAGTCLIAANQAGDANYKVAPQVIGRIEIRKVDQTISFTPPPDKIIGDAPFTINATVTSGLTVIFSSITDGVCTVDAGTVTLISVGTCLIAANQAGDANYHAAPQVIGSIEISFTVAGLLSSVTVDHEWHPVDSAPLSEHSVIITAPPSFNGKQPGVVRVKRLDSGGFDLRFQEWEYLDGRHKNEVVAYLVLEPGRHTMSDGSIWEVGTFTLAGVADRTENALWPGHAFSQPFTEGIPWLFLTVQTTQGGQAISVRARNVTESGFEVALFEQEAFMNGSHKEETVGYLAIYNATDSGTINLGNEVFSYTLRQPMISHQWQAVLASTLMVEEEQSVDDEIRHKSEDIDVLELGSFLFAQDVSSLGRDSMALRQQPIDE